MDAILGIFKFDQNLHKAHLPLLVILQKDKSRIFFRSQLPTMIQESVPEILESVSFFLYIIIFLKEFAKKSLNGEISGGIFRRIE